MHPILFQIGPLKFYMYGLMIAIGFILILTLMQRDAKRVGIDPNQISEMAFWVLFLGVVACRLLHIIMYPEGYSWNDPIGWIAVWNGGLVFQGAIPAALIYIYFALRRRGLPFWEVADLTVPYVPLAQAFGRVGCLFNGCCFGQRADHLPWAIQFPPDSPPYVAHVHEYPEFPADAALSYPVHPTQLYSVVLLVGMSVVMLLMRNRWKPFIGFALPMYFMLYGVKRFIVEHYRGDDNPTNLGFGLITNQQMFCVLMFLVGAVLFWTVMKKNYTSVLTPLDEPTQARG